MAWVETKITGLDELQRKLEELPPKVAQKVLREGLRDGAEIVRDAFIAAAPSPETYAEGGKRTEAAGTGRTILGHLRDLKSWKIRYKGRPEDYAGSAYVGPSNTVLETRTSGETKGLPRTAAFIVKMLEFGSRTRSGHPFATSAWESVKQKVLDKIIDSIREALE